MLLCTSSFNYEGREWGIQMLIFKHEDNIFHQEKKLGGPDDSRNTCNKRWVATTNMEFITAKEAHLEFESKLLQDQPRQLIINLP